MPVYDYVCLDCHKSFETVLTVNEHDKETPKCPHCGSKSVEQEAAAFACTLRDADSGAILVEGTLSVFRPRTLDRLLDGAPE